jgi:hypothetical protein
MKDGLQRRDFLRGIAAGFLTSRVYGAVSVDGPEGPLEFGIADSTEVA